MKPFNQSILEVIGNTPIIKLNKVAHGTDSEIYVKLEYMNPGGSIKDRIGPYILEQAVKKGELKPGGTIIEGTSGNTGVGLAMYAAVHGYKSIFVLADKQSQEKINNLRAFGAKVIVCPTNVEPDDPQSYYSVSKRLADTIPNSFYVNQYHNLDNRNCHINTTGPEIFAQTDGEFDVFMAGVGTGGTISGIGTYLKSQMPDLKVVGVDIEGSILAHYHKTGEMCEAKPYVLEGIGEDIIPENIDFKIIDDFVVVQDKESFVMTRKLLTQEGIYAGGSSGAAVAGAIKYAKTLDKPKKILVVLPDSGNRYQSKIFNDDWMRDQGYNDLSFNVMISEVLKELGKKNQNIIGVDDKTTIQQAINQMKESGYSQLPVYSDGKIIGIVREQKLLRPVFEGTITLEDNISVGLESTFDVVSIHELLDKVASSLLEKRTVFLTENDKIVNILTHIDILEFITKKGAY